MCTIDYIRSLLVKIYDLKENFTSSNDKHKTGLKIVELLKKAHEYLQKLLLSQPDNSEVYNNLGIVLYELNKPQEAEAYYLKAISINQNNFEAYNNLGLLLKQEQRYKEAEKYLRNAIKIKPDYPEAFNNLGMVLKRIDSLDSAEKSFRTAIQLNSAYVAAYINLAHLLIDKKKMDNAKKCLTKALQINDKSAHAKFLLGAILLIQGKYSEGWKLYELRRRLFNMYQPSINYWNGEELQEKKILLFTEPGFGETIQFIRFADIITYMAKHTTVWVQRELYNFFSKQNFKFSLYSGKKEPEGNFDFSCSLQGLPAVLQITPKNVPQKSPYLKPLESDSIRWNRILKQDIDLNKKNIGIVWAGNPLHKNDYKRSIPFEIFKELLAIDNLNWISLQVGKHAKDYKKFNIKLYDYSEQLTNFNETAALISNLELVISVDTAVAHLSGALNKKIWLMVPYVPDWRWQLDGDKSVWYSSLKIFRQQENGNWSEVIKSIKSELKKFLVVNN